MSLLDLGPRTATVTAEDDSILFAITARDFSKLLDNVPIVARRVLAALSERLRQSRNAPSYRWNLPATSWNRR
jgi:CRP-like cAMP-binding protein